MISARWGHFLDGPLAPIARTIKLDPNVVTFIGFFITLVAAVAITIKIEVGGILLLLGGLFDILDGVVARVNGKVSKFGAFFDSVLDRFSDAAIFCALGLHFYISDDPVHAVVSMITLIGAFGVSYARARAEGLGYECHVGFMERPERIVLVASGCLFTVFLIPSLWIILLGSYVTVIQRVLHIRKSDNQRENQENDTVRVES